MFCFQGDLPRSPSSGASTLKLKALEEANSALKEEVEIVKKESTAASQRLVSVDTIIEWSFCVHRQLSDRMALTVWLLYSESCECLIIFKDTYIS